MSYEDYFKSEQWSAYLKLMEERPAAFQDSEQIRIITDPETVMEFIERTGRTIGVLYQSPFSILVVDLVRDAGGEVFAYERLLRQYPAARLSLFRAAVTRSYWSSSIATPYEKHSCHFRGALVRKILTR